MTEDGSGADFGRALLVEARRRLLGESVPRLKKCLGLLSQEEVWRHPNAETASVGNLVLHLLGNVRQYVVSGLGGAPDRRRRAQEFAEAGPLPTSELLSRLDALVAEVEEALDRVDPVSLLEKRRVQGFEESGLSILVHVVEHFSYHVGQISYVTKARLAVDLKYYDGVNLEATS